MFVSGRWRRGGGPGVKCILNNSCVEIWTGLNWHEVCSMAGFFEPDNASAVYTKKWGIFISR